MPPANGTNSRSKRSARFIRRWTKGPTQPLRLVVVKPVRYHLTKTQTLTDANRRS